MFPKRPASTVHLSGLHFLLHSMVSWKGNRKEIKLDLHLKYILEWYSSTAQGTYIYRATISNNPFHLVHLEIQDNLQEQLVLCPLKLKAQYKDISIWPYEHKSYISVTIGELYSCWPFFIVCSRKYKMSSIPPCNHTDNLPKI